MENLYSLPLKALSCAEYNNSQGGILKTPELCFGSLESDLLRILTAKLKGLNVLTVYTDDSYKLLSNRIKEIFSYSSSRASEYITDGNPKNSREIFSFLEEFRCVIAIGEECVNAAKIFAFERKIPLVIIPVFGDMSFMLSNYAFTEEKGLWNFRFSPCAKTVIFDKKISYSSLTEKIHKTCSLALCYLTGLFDLSAGEKTGEYKVNKEAVNLLKYSVNGFLRLKKSDPEFSIKALEYAVKTALAELISDNAHILCTSPFWCALSGKINPCLYSEKLLDLYSVYFSSDGTVLPSTPDYNGDIERISAEKGIAENVLYAANKLDAKKAFEKEKTLLPEKEKYLSEIQKMKKILPFCINALEESGARDLNGKINVSDVKTAAYISPNYILLKSVRDMGMFV